MRSGDWRRIGAWTLVAISLLAIGAIVAASANPEYYYFRTEEDRRAFAPNAWAIGIAFALSVGESTVLISILCVGRRLNFAIRLLLAWAIFVPWMFVVWDELGTHVPGVAAP